MPVTNYTVIDGELVHENRAGVEHDYVPDPLGSTVALLNSSQTQTDTYTFWPYGEVRTSTGTTATPFQFVGTLGYYRDSAQRTYVRKRYLAMWAGRWLTPDQIRFLFDDWNGYRYVRNAPTVLSDPSGLVCVKLGGNSGIVIGCGGGISIGGGKGIVIGGGGISIGGGKGIVIGGGGISIGGGKGIVIGGGGISIGGPGGIGIGRPHPPGLPSGCKLEGEPDSPERWDYCIDVCSGRCINSLPRGFTYQQFIECVAACCAVCVILKVIIGGGGEESGEGASIRYF